MLRRAVWRRLPASSSPPPPHTGPFDPYKILGLPPTATTHDVKRAYRRLALRFHPDSGAEGNAARFAAVHEAYAALKDGPWRPDDARRRAAAAHSPYNTTTTTGEGSRGDRDDAAAGGQRDGYTRMYVYEQPGSTRDGYVSGHTATMLRVFMWSCFVFVALRLFLLRRAPPRAVTSSTPAATEDTATDAPSSSSSSLRAHDVHTDGVHNTSSSSTTHRPDTARDAAAADPSVWPRVHVTSTPTAPDAAFASAAATTSAVTNDKNDDDGAATAAAVTGSDATTTWWRGARSADTDPLARRT